MFSPQANEGLGENFWVLGLRLNGLHKIRLIDVAPIGFVNPFQQLDNGMSGRLEVLGGVLVARRIATADMSAGEAHP